MESLKEFFFGPASAPHGGEGISKSVTGKSKSLLSDDLSFGDVFIRDPAAIGNTIIDEGLGDLERFVGPVCWLSSDGFERSSWVVVSDFSGVSTDGAPVVGAEGEGKVSSGVLGDNGIPKSVEVFNVVVGGKVNAVASSVSVGEIFGVPGGSVEGLMDVSDIVDEEPEVHGVSKSV